MANGKIKEGSSKTAVHMAIRRFYVHMAALLLILLAIAFGAYWLFSGKQGNGQPPLASVARDAPQIENRFDRLKGRWVRPDGGYVLEIKEIGSDGKMKVGYFNPLPINVSRAEAADDGKNLKVFIELRDVNYPGATYQLTYDPDKDQLKGIYTQPALQQSFQIFFIREKDR